MGLSFIARFFRKSPPIGKNDPPIRKKERFTFEDQLRYEAEGGAAGLAGKTRDDCPYDREVQPGPWNHWVYGNDVARHEVETIKNGTISWYSTSCTDFSGPPTLQTKVADSIRDGTWKPRFAKLPPSSIIPRSSD